jgi:hypothetical protein
MKDNTLVNKIRSCPGPKKCFTGIATDYLGQFSVMCDCGWEGPSRKTEEEAILAWNKRG